MWVSKTTTITSNSDKPLDESEVMDRLLPSHSKTRPAPIHCLLALIPLGTLLHTISSDYHTDHVTGQCNSYVCETGAPRELSPACQSRSFLLAFAPISSFRQQDGWWYVFRVDGPFLCIPLYIPPVRGSPFGKTCTRGPLENMGAIPRLGKAEGYREWTGEYSI